MMEGKVLGGLLHIQLEYNWGVSGYNSFISLNSLMLLSTSTETERPDSTWYSLAAFPLEVPGSSRFWENSASATVCHSFILQNTSKVIPWSNHEGLLGCVSDEWTQREQHSETSKWGLPGWLLRKTSRHKHEEKSWLLDTQGTNRDQQKGLEAF